VSSLIIVGIVALAYGGFSYTTREQVIDVGPLEVTKEERRTFPIPPIAGGALLAGGLVLVVVGARGR
jgi:hypothetical protein